MKRIFSGVQPTGNLHLGNYLGAIKQWVELQHDFPESIFCVVDLHAITVPQDPKKLQENILSVAAWYIAAGVNLTKSKIFVQSSRPEHTELAWILNCNSTMGELSRMTQFKEKSGGERDNVSVGLFDYPVLMAADILLYNATHVPVGDDQKQHVELARNIAQRFNNKYGETFVVPEPVIKKESARIMGLDNPEKKMSKSAESEYNYILLSDSAEDIERKIKRAVTDSGSEVKACAEKPAITNLLNIYSEVTGKTVSEIESQYVGKNYGEFKAGLAQAVIEFLTPIQKKYAEVMADKSGLIKILEDGANAVEPIAAKTLTNVKTKVGLGIK